MDVDAELVTFIWDAFATLQDTWPDFKRIPEKELQTVITNRVMGYLYTSRIRPLDPIQWQEAIEYVLFGKAPNN